jgi:serine/threonine-protein kinase
VRPGITLEAQFPNGEVRQLDVGEGGATVGRDVSSDLQLDDPTVSRRQVVIAPTASGWSIESVGRGRVRLNGAPVGETPLAIAPGDVFEVSVIRIRVLATSPPSADFSRSSLATHVSAPIPPQPPPPPQAPVAAGALGVLDGRYELEELIAETSTGTIYRARRTLLGDRVAVRILKRSYINNPEALERFRRQARVAARIHHPNVVQVFDFNALPDGTVYLAEELLSGRTLRDLIRERGAMTFARVAGILNQVCGAVHAAHINGIVLRDLKPESIFLERSADGRDYVKVGGFGLAKITGHDGAMLTMAGAARIFGTPQYMAPEQWTGQPLDSRADVYALGVILFEMLTGARPFEADQPARVAQMQLENAAPNLSDLRSDIDEGIAAVVARALDPNPALRQPSALYLASEFEAASELSGGIVRAIVNKATGRLLVPPPVVVNAPAPAPAGEPVLPSVVAPPEERGGRLFTPVLIALMGEAFLSRLSSGIVKTAFPIYALLVFGFDITTVMALVLVQNVVPLLLRPAFGSLADRYGKKRIFLISVGTRTLVSALYAAVVSPWMFFIISAIRGIADSAKGPSASAMIADNTDERRIASAFSWYQTIKSTSGGIGESLASFLLIGLLLFVTGQTTVTATVAVLDKTNSRGEQVEEIVSGPDAVAADNTLPGDGEAAAPQRVLRVEQRQMRLSDVPLDDLPKVVDTASLRRGLVILFLLSAFLSLLSVVLIAVVLKEKKKEKKEKGAIADVASMTEPVGRPNVWAFALLGAALTAPAYMVTGEFFTILAIKLEVTPSELGWIKLVAETAVPLLMGPFFGWLADRIGAGKVIAMRSVANLATSLLFWITPWFAGTALLAIVMGLARGVDEIGKAAFKPTWGAIAAKVSSFDLAKRGRTMGVLEAGVDASDLIFPVVAGALLQFLSLGWLMAARAALAALAEVYAILLTRKYKV